MRWHVYVPRFMAYKPTYQDSHMPLIYPTGLYAKSHTCPRSTIEIFSCMTWLMHSCDTTHSHMAHDLCACSSVWVLHMGLLRLVGSWKLYVSFAKEPYKRDYILQKRPIILRSLQVVATPYQHWHMPNSTYWFWRPTATKCSWHPIYSYTTIHILFLTPYIFILFRTAMYP